MRPAAVVAGQADDVMAIRAHARTAAGEADAAEALCEAFAAWMTRGG
jgi:hypothetical protein